MKGFLKPKLSEHGSTFLYFQLGKFSEILFQNKNKETNFLKNGLMLQLCVKILGSILSTAKNKTNTMLHEKECHTHSEDQDKYTYSLHIYSTWLSKS